MTDSSRVAAVDCGTNSIRLLVAEAARDAAGAWQLRDLDRRMEVVRLGAGVDRTGVLDPAALERTLVACRVYAAQCAALDARRIRFVATSATRDARNAADFREGVRAAFGDLGVEPEVVSGEEEAELSFRGATGDLLARRIPAPYLVVDIGGGSTELVLGRTDIDAAVSLDMGSVRMTERHFASDPPTAEQVAAAAAEIDALLDEAEQSVALGAVASVVGLAGSITTVTAHLLRLAAYDSTAVHLAEASIEDQRQAAQDLLAMPRAERAALGFMHPGRVDVIGAGALIWERVLARVAERSPQARVVTSEHDILDGIALSLLA